MFFKKKIQVVTHSGSFHSDDVFAAAVLDLYFKKNNQKHNLTRSTDSDVINAADIVFDIGGVYDIESKRFDHHQKGGAGERENGIPYAAFGLIWKEYGLELCDGNVDVWNQIDKSLVQSIDAGDNGINLFESINKSATPVLVQSLFASLNISFDESPSLLDQRFDEASYIAARYLERTLHQTKAQQKINDIVKEAYNNSDDTRLVIMDEAYGRMPLSVAVSAYDKILYFVYPSGRSGAWSVCASRIKSDSFESKKPFPEEWRGLRDGQMAEVSGISDTTFCHNSGFLCGAKTKEAAIELAKKALEA